VVVKTEDIIITILVKLNVGNATDDVKDVIFYIRLLIF